MANTEPMVCAPCGATMNNHAEKVDASGAMADDDAVGGVFEVFTCPACGGTKTRPEAAE